ncbi:AAA domain-containing protein [Mycoplasma procyoni]|uniref:AAA domain-containing protein n=1 Tax=Mycoplasma procyoni TaxID=568784 RepID=UPI00197C886F|nr:AAA domain-containing protein [Mycoplasma procyoni]MBN3534673.1 AAA family ATPase [Mycoplasma procyoni]
MESIYITFEREIIKKKIDKKRDQNIAGGNPNFLDLLKTFHKLNIENVEDAFNYIKTLFELTTNKDYEFETINMSLNSNWISEVYSGMKNEVDCYFYLIIQRKDGNEDFLFNYHKGVSLGFKLRIMNEGMQILWKIRDLNSISFFRHSVEFDQKNESYKIIINDAQNSDNSHLNLKYFSNFDTNFERRIKLSKEERSGDETINFFKWKNLIHLYNKTYSKREGVVTEFLFSLDNKEETLNFDEIEERIKNEKLFILSTNEELLIDKSWYLSMPGNPESEFTNFEIDLNPKFTSMEEIKEKLKENEFFDIEKEIENKKENNKQLERNIRDLNYEIQNINTVISQKESKIKLYKPFILRSKVTYDDIAGASYLELVEAGIVEKEEKELRQERLNKRKEISNQIQQLKNELSQKENELSKERKKIENNNWVIKEKEDKKEEINNFIESIPENLYFYNVRKITTKNENEDSEVNFKFKRLNAWENKTIQELMWFFPNDIGKIMKINRYKNALDNIVDGYYKNPYLLISIFNERKISNQSLKSAEKSLEESGVIKKHNLNERQALALKKAVATQDTFFLQGPPGTGKTQTISAIIEHEIFENNVVLITSSTHEAISNALERVDNVTKNNPNVIIYKGSNAFSSKTEQFGEEKLYSNFLNKIDNSILQKDSNATINSFIKQIDNLISESEQLGKNNILNLYIVNIETKINSILDKKESNLYKIIEDYISPRMIREGNKEKIVDEFKKVMSEEIENLDKFEILINNIKESFPNVINKSNNIEDLKKELEEIKKSSKNKDNLSDLISKYNEKYKDRDKNEQIKSDDEDEFLNYVLDKNLINVIGITTSAKPCIKNKDLYLDYNVDTVIIDEISKSSTPEIFSRILLSNKVIFSGDYKQLPPSNEFTEAEMQRMFENKREFLKFYKENTFKERQDFQDHIEQLFKTSFFDRKINKIRKQSEVDSLNKNYEHLTESHRFNKSIMELVNLYYDKDEKLEIPKNSKHKFEEKINIKIDGQNYNIAETILVDTTYLSDKFKDKLIREYKINIPFNGNSFDQNGEKNLLLNKNGNITLKEGTYNEYNISIIIEILHSIFEEYGIEYKDDIGIICLTRSQATVLKKYLELDENKKLKVLKIKVDTIDNFQGREKKIVIVDFIRAKNKLNKNFISEPKGKRNIEFLKEENRINVAISRAQNAMILIGSFRYYDQEAIQEKGNLLRKIWKQFNDINEANIIKMEEK